MTVECYAGIRYAERPRAFLWESKRIRVQEIERQWRTPEGLVFRVRAADGRRFFLTYDETDDRWQVAPHYPNRGGNLWKP